MKLAQLEYMVAIVEHGSLRAAARQLGLAQPALTRGVRLLEHELGAPLFLREAQGMALTQEGRLFHQRASAVVNDLRRATEEIGQSLGSTQGTITVGLSIMPHVGMLPHALPIFRHRYPDVELKLIEGLYPAVESSLREGKMDFYLGASPRQTALAQGLVSELIFRNTRTVVARNGHPLAGAGSLTELAGADWATTSIDYNGAEDLTALFAKYRLPAPKILLQAHSALSVIVGLACSDLLAMLPVQWNEFPLTRGVLQVVNVRQRLPAPSIVCIRRAGLPLTPAADYFCDLLRRRAPTS